MNVWLLDEGTPGHTVQTEGVGEILGSRLGAKLTWVRCKLKLPGWQRAVTRWRVGRKGPGGALRFAKQLYPGLEIPAGEQADLVISSCGKSAYLNRLLCAETGARGVFIGERKPFPANWFDLIITPVEEGIGNELLMPVIESGKSPESGMAAREGYWPEGAPQGCWTVLIGGSSRTHRYGKEDWEALADGINSLARNNEVRWLLSTSRRTGAEGELILKKQINPEVTREAVWYGSEPKKAVGAFLAAGERIFVTQDSLTMMSEGLAMDKRIELLVPRDWEMPKGSFNGAYVSRLLGEGLVGRTNISDLAEYIPDGDGRACVSPLREIFAEKIAEWAKSRKGEA